jgi:maltoporin
MGPRPTPDYTLERVDNDRGYSPDNCVWATKFEQNRNRRDLRLFTIEGKTQCLTDWCREYGMNTSTVKSRLISGWSAKDAFTVPADRKNKWRGYRQTADLLEEEGKGEGDG